jgi:hypothetical protein
MEGEVQTQILCGLRMMPHGGLRALRRSRALTRTIPRRVVRLIRVGVLNAVHEDSDLECVTSGGFLLLAFRSKQSSVPCTSA